MSRLLKRNQPEQEQVINYRDGGAGFSKWCEANVCIPVYHGDSYVPQWTPMCCLPTIPNPNTGRSYSSFWENQKTVLTKALAMTNGRFHHRLIIFCWQRGEGKCQKKGSEVLLFNGFVKKVEEVKVGDFLMGDDNTPREVLSLTSGTEEMFEVIPKRGEPLTVTKDHILSLKCGGNHRRALSNIQNPGQVIDISVKDFMKKSKWFRQLYHLYKVPVEFPEQLVPIDPYFLGMWLADGHSHQPTITTMDKETVDYIYTFAKKENLSVTLQSKEDCKASSYSLVTPRGTKNPLLDLLRENNLIRNKHIPQVYKINSRKIRMQILAGLIDGDGYKNRNSIHISQKNKTLSEDITFLARSLGFHVCIKKSTKRIKSTGFSGEYYGIGITGDCSSIPLKIERRKCSPRRVGWKNHLNTCIKMIRSVGKQEYYGFTLDGNGRYVTSDFTVTHNSFIAVLIQLWKFFCFPRQMIMLGANSKEQTKFVHYDIMRDIILNSPKLLRVIGRKNIQEKEIKLRDKRGNIGSFIRSISTSTGIVSNVTGYTFSEMFDMTNPKFFVQLDGSIRNIPNALGVIDSTVSAKTHILYKLYQTFTRNKDPFLFFSHRYSPNASASDYWNPQMTQEQLNSYENKFPRAEFERYFKNTWEAGSNRFFTREMIQATHYLGADGTTGQQQRILDTLKRVNSRDSRVHERIHKTKNYIDTENIALTRSLIKVSSVYTLHSDHLHPRKCSLSELEALSNLYKTDFAILVGIDRADPMKIDLTAGARTIVTVIAKGLPNSKNNPEMYLEEGLVKDYIYLLLHLAYIESNELKHVKATIKSCIDEYDGVETICSERWGMWDVNDWCAKQEIGFEAISPSYDRQKEAFSELWTLYKTGKFKTPKIYIAGSKEDDILEEEALRFDSNPFKKWYGSAEKDEKHGVQDDAIYSLAWGIYGGRMLGPEEFRERRTPFVWGEVYQPKDLVGAY